MFTPTPEQSSFYHALSTSSSNIILNACAGAGKTTTILEALTRIPRDPDAIIPPSVLFLAFNKSIADTLRSRVPRGINCSTFHSLGFGALKRSGHVPRDVKVDGGKCRKLVFNALGNENPDVQNVVKLVSLLKTKLNASPEEMAVLHDLTFDDPRTAFRTASSVRSASNKDLRTIDFDDMLYLPVLFDAPFDHMDYIFVDEAQDTNDIQLEVIDRLLQPGVRKHEWQKDGFCKWCQNTHQIDVSPRPCWTQPSSSRLFFVGDPHQAIYGFRGANSDSMTKIRDRYNCVEMPLSVSFRCSQAVVAEARKALTSEL